MSQPIRNSEQRRRDTLASLEARNHLWIATASAERPAPYLVPVSFAWTGDAFIVATSSDSPTALNLFASRIARLAIGPTDDVVLVDAQLQSAVAVASAPSELADRYAEQSDWDPRTGTELPSHYFVLAPSRIQAWRLASELPGRTIMRDGRWLTPS
jgi:hypothetical protein